MFIQRFSLSLNRLVLALLVLMVCGCSAITELRSDISDRLFGAEPPNPPAELKDIIASYKIKVDWSTQLGDTTQYDYTPAINAGAVYATSTEGEISKIDLPSGKILWQVSIGEPISGGVGVEGGLVLVGTNKGHLYALDASGKILWMSILSSELLSVPKYYDGVVIARTGDNHIYGIDAADGSRKWVYERSSPSLTLRSSVGLVVDGGAVYAGFAGGKFVAVRADNGKLIWESTIAQPKGVTEIERIADITSLPFVDGPVVYVVAYQGRVAAVDRRTGEVVWNRDISSYRGLTAEAGKIYISHTLGSVYSLDNTNGRTFWRQGDLSNRRLTAPLSMGSIIAVGDLEGYIHLLSRDDGKFVGRIKIDDNPVMALVSAGESHMIAQTRGGGLFALTYQ